MPAQRLAKRSSKRTNEPFLAYRTRPGDGEINANHLRFIEEYMVDLDATGAAIRAGFSPKSANSQGSQLLSKPKIKEEIERRIAKRAKKMQLKSENVVDELIKSAFSNMRNYIRLTADGEPYFDLTDCTEDHFAAISEFVVEDFKDGRGEDARDVKRVKIKLIDKTKNLELLGKHLGMFKDSLMITGPDGGPVQVQAVRRILVEEGKMRDITPKKKKE